MKPRRELSNEQRFFLRCGMKEGGASVFLKADVDCVRRLHNRGLVRMHNGNRPHVYVTTEAGAKLLGERERLDGPPLDHAALALAYCLSAMPGFDQSELHPCV
jgi:hypothetical protein